MNNQETAAAISSAASATMYGGSGGALVAAWNAEWVVGMCGVAIALVGLIVNIYYKHQHLKLAKARADLPMEDDEDA